MPHLIGLAFTSPVAVYPAIPDPYVVHVYGTDAALADFCIAHSATRKLVVFVTNVRDLVRLTRHRDALKLTGVIVYDDAFVLRALRAPGMHLLDVQTTVPGGLENVDVHITDILAVLERRDPGPLSVDFQSRDEAEIMNGLASPATIRDLVGRIVADVPESYRAAATKTCVSLVVRTTTKPAWLVSVIQAFQTVSHEAAIEFERYAEVSADAAAIWRAFYDVAENALDLKVAAERHSVDIQDLRYVTEIVSPVPGLVYMQTPVAPKVKKPVKVATPKKSKKAVDEV